ncbi:MULTISPECIES: hypothetical protein, partial [unclassified Psychrobacter]
SFASRAWVNAFSPLPARCRPVIANAGAATIPPSTKVPPAIPNPPAAKDPPPSHASVALLAAAPDNAEIAVPVEAEASKPTDP